MARVNMYIFGIRELKWTGMGKFNSDEHCIYNSGQKSLRRNSGPHSQLESKTQYLGAISNTTE